MTQRAAASRVFFISEIYYPDETSTGYIFTRLAESLARKWEVHVLCGHPRYDKRGTRTPNEEVRNGVAITRCWGTTFSRHSLLGRLINVVAITISLGWEMRRAVRPGDIAIIATNPPTLPFSAVWNARRRGARTLLIVHDVMPETLIAAGMTGPSSSAARFLRSVHRWLYRQFDGIAVLGRDMAELVSSRFTAEHAPRLTVVRNWADLDLVVPSERSDNPVLRRLGLTDRFVVQYAGNMGKLHDVALLIDAAVRLERTHPNVHFLFVGDGTRRKWLEAEIAKRGLANVTLVQRFAREEQPAFLNACDVAITALVPGMYGASVPSRMYNVMAAGKPWIAAVDRGSELGLVITEEDAGWVVVPGDVDGVVAAIVEAEGDPTAAIEKGRRGRRAAEEKYSFESASQSLEEVVTELNELLASAK